MSSPPALNVLHIGSGRYRPQDRSHTTYAIWRELARGFQSYHVIARSAEQPAEWIDGNLRITLIRSWTRRDIEFVFTQFLAVPSTARERSDVIVCQSPVAGGLASIVISWMTGAKLLMEFHGAEFFAPARSSVRLWILQSLTRLALGKADSVRVLTQRMGALVAQRYGRELAECIQVLPPRVDLATFSGGGRAGAGKEPLALAIIGTVNDNKGQARLLKALAAAPLSVQLHVVGAGPGLSDCQTLASRLAGSKVHLRVTFHGEVSPAEVAAILKTCDVSVTYSRTEATPRAIMEAMAMGLPVVTTDAGFCADIVEDGVEGFVLGPDPDAEILEVIERFASDRSLARRMGAAARERAHRDFDSVRLFEEYRQLIAETARR